MSPKTGDTDPSSSKKIPLRLQMPADDPDIEAFLAAQGARFQSQAIVMLIRMWVNEFGPVNVLDRTMDAVTVSALRHNSLSGHASGSPAPRDTDVPAQTAPATSVAHPEVETPQKSASTPQRTSPSTPATEPPASDDFESFFRKP